MAYFDVGKVRALPVTRSHGKGRLSQASPFGNISFRVHFSFCRRRVGPGISPEPLTDPCLTVSHHTARAIPESCRPPPKPAGSSCCQLALYGSSADDPPPSLHGHYSASSLLRGDPPLDAASVLSPSWFNPLAAFPLATTPSFPRSLRSPLPGSAHLYAGCRSARKQAPSELVPRSSNYRGLDIV